MSGIQFDPTVVEAFIKYLDANNTSVNNEISKPNILVVDDEESIVTILTARPKDINTMCIIADSGDAALEIINRIQYCGCVN